MRNSLLILVTLTVSACASQGGAEPATPSDAARHRAALATLSVVNETSLSLQIAFRTAVPPIQETVIGRVEPNARAAMAPVPAGEPVIMVARRADGAEYQGRVQSFPLDGAVVWSIPKTATFLLREPAK
jgi:hypothetical protein